MAFTAGSAVITFFLTPFLLRHIGTEAYGIYILVLSVTGVLGFVGSGLNEAIIRTVAFHSGRGDMGSVARTVRTASALYTAAALVGWACIHFAAPSVAVLLKMTSAGGIDAVFLMRAAAVTFALNFAGGAYTAVPAALQRYDIRAQVGIGQLVFQTAGSIVVLATGFGLQMLVVWMAASALVVLVTNFVVARSLIPGLRVVPSINRSAMRQILGFSAFSIVTYAFGTVWLYADRFILGAVVSATAVAYFTVPCTLAFRALDFVSSTGAALFPRFSATADPEERSRLFLDATWVLTALAGVILIPCAALIPTILQLWVGPEFALRSSHIGQLIFVSCTVRGAAVVYQGLCNGMGRPRVLTIVTIISATLTTAANLILIPHFGLRGVGYGYCLSSFVAVATVLWVWRSLLGASEWSPIVAAFLVPVLSGLAVLGVLYYFPATGAGWLQLILRAAVYALLTALTIASAEAVFSGRRRLDQLALRLRSLVVAPRFLRV